MISEIEIIICSIVVVALFLDLGFHHSEILHYLKLTIMQLKKSRLDWSRRKGKGQTPILVMRSPGGTKNELCHFHGGMTSEINPIRVYLRSYQ
jgi:hypothetical protein